MKLSTLMILVALLQVNANTLAQKVTLSEKNTPLAEVFNKISAQTSYDFLFTTTILSKAKPITIKVKNGDLNKVLERIFADQPLEYSIEDKSIVVRAKTILRPSGIKKTAILTEIQQNVVTGSVADTTGAPLPGVSITVKDTNSGTTTDENGNFILPNAPENASLRFELLGFEPIEIALGTRTNIQVVMRTSLSELSQVEVVAIGYGTVKKSDLTGSVSAIQSDVLEKRQEATISQALQGTMPGVMVTRSNNSPGSAATIRIRGITTIGDSEPLIIKDGVPINNINAINPNDIESISVLKDAASASIYGARAASGVILVTTKRAKAGQLDLSYNFEYGFEKPTEMAEYAGPIRYMEMFNEWGWNDNNNTGSEYPTYAMEHIENYYSMHEQNPDLYPVTDWADLMLKESAPRQSHIIAYSAGTNTLQSKGSITYDKVDGLYMKRSWDRLTLNINNDVTINKYFKATLDLSARYANDKNPIFNPMFHTRITPAIYAAKWSDGRTAQAKSGDNIYGVLKEGGFSNSSNNWIWAKLALDFSPVEGLTLSAVASGNLDVHKGKRFQILAPYYAWDDPTRRLGYLHMGSQHQGAQSTSLTEIRNDSRQVTTQFLANYTKSIEDHSFNATLGNENYQFFSENMGGSRDQYTLTSFPYLNLGPLDFRGNTGSAFENAYTSFFGRIMYSYKNKYLLQANIRFDASSRLHPDYRWGSFPSISAGWVITEEDFLPSNNTLSFLKIRASWGRLGNERIGNYPYQATIAFGNALFYSGSNVVSAQTASQDKYVIQDISWETTESYNLGLDATLFSGRLHFTGDIYKKTTKDMLLALEIPDYIGLGNPDQNTGEMYTNGWDLEIAWRNSIKDFRYSVSFNLSDFRSVMGDLGGTEFLGSKIRIEGSEFDEWYGYLSGGLFQTQEEVNNSPALNSNVKAGDVRYVDVSGPNGQPDGIISPEYDRVLLGGSLPRYMYGSNIQLSYKNVDFSVMVQGVGKQNVTYDPLMMQPFIERWGNVPSIIDGNYWSVYNTPEQNQNARFPRLSSIGESNNYAPMSDFWMFSGAYLRIKNITLGYTIPKNLTDRVKCDEVYLYAGVSDILSFDKYPKGWDPEVSGTGYPITTSVLFGVSVKF